MNDKTPKSLSSDAFLNALLKTLPVKLAYVGRDLKYQYLNEAYASWHGVPISGCLGIGLRDVLGVEAFDSVKEFLDRALNGERVVFERELPYRINGTKFVQAHYVPDVSEAGDTRGVFIIVKDLTPCFEAKKALEKKEQETNRILDTLPAMIGHWSKDFLNISANVVYADYFGKSPAEIKGRHIKDVIGPDLFEKNYPYMQAALRGESQTFEREIPLAKGGSKHTIASYLPDVVDGAVDGFVVIVTDITEIKKRDVELAQSEAKWKSLFNLLPVGVSIIDANGAIGETNPALRKILAITPEGLAAGSYRNRQYVRGDGTPMGRDDLPSVRAINQQKIILNNEIGIKIEDGSTIWTEVSAAPMDLDDAKCVLVTLDVTEKKNVQRRLLEAEQEQRLIIENFPGAVARIDCDYRFVFANKTMAEWFGQSQTPLVGKAIVEVSSAAFSQEIMPFAKRSIAGEVLSYEFQTRLASGKMMYWQKSLIPDRDADGKITGFFFFAFDTSPLKKAEMQLLQSSKMAALGEMASGVAHEVNNPLAIILGRCERLRKSVQVNDPSMQALVKDVDGIIGTAHRIAKIVKGLQTFSRNGEKDLMTWTSASEIVGECLNICQERFASSGVELRCPPIPEVKIRCRGTQISQVLLNLLNNAFDAVQSVGIKWVQLEVVPLGAERVEFAVTDSGEGVAEAITGKIMEPFFTTKDVGKGSGLGLSISQGIAHDHNGNLELDRSSSATRFVLSLPRDCQTPRTAGAA